MLAFHHDAPGRVVSATVLAEVAGFEGYGGANLQYGLLGGEILRELGIELPDDYAKAGILVEFVDPRFAANQQWLWVMRPNVALALEELGWAPCTLQMLYPNEGLE